MSIDPFEPRPGPRVDPAVLNRPEAIAKMRAAMKPRKKNLRRELADVVRGYGEAYAGADPDCVEAAAIALFNDMVDAVRNELRIEMPDPVASRRSKGKRTT